MYTRYDLFVQTVKFSYRLSDEFHGFTQRIRHRVHNTVILCVRCCKLRNARGPTRLDTDWNPKVCWQLGDLVELDHALNIRLRP